MVQNLGLSIPTIIDWNNYCREVCLKWMDQSSERRGGPAGTVVEVDEAKFGKRKYNRGRIWEGQWVFGGIERGNKRIFLVPVPDRTSGTLLSVIQEHVEPGTTIMSDCWRAYNILQNSKYRHLTVNHSMNFVDPDSGTHTQNIERLWRDVRHGIPRFGRSERHFPGYLAEFQFKREILLCRRIIESYD